MASLRGQKKLGPRSNWSPRGLIQILLLRGEDTRVNETPCVEYTTIVYTSAWSPSVTYMKSILSILAPGKRVSNLLATWTNVGDHVGKFCVFYPCSYQNILPLKWLISWLTDRLSFNAIIYLLGAPKFQHIGFLVHGRQPGSGMFLSLALENAKTRSFILIAEWWSA